MRIVDRVRKLGGATKLYFIHEKSFCYRLVMEGGVNSQHYKTTILKNLRKLINLEKQEEQNSNRIKPKNHDAAYFKFLFRKRRENEPPIPTGHWFWGNGEEFSKNAVKFLHSTQKKIGDIFTIRLFNQHMTVILDPHSYEKFVKERNFDFDKIQKQVNHNVFSFELVNARKMLKEAGKL
ncbi:CYP8A [Mytilus edulis]|uniref:PTGIS n=1 Tax=Mytilus edulis TaxID=6550 RepID=A0A8S3QTT8_MYTED|nr:CYP8A [Mytilus edulis]